MNITQLCQTAFYTYLTSLGLDNVPDGQIYKGIENLNPASDYIARRRLLPCVTVECLRATESAHATGNWTATVIIKCRSNADDTDEDDHHEFTSEVLSNIWHSDIRAHASAALSGFTVFQVRAKEQGYDLIERSWESYIMLEVECCAADL